MNEPHDPRRIDEALEMFMDFLIEYRAESDAMRVARHRKALGDPKTARKVLMRIKDDADRLYSKVRQQTRKGRYLPGSNEQDTLKRLGNVFRGLNEALFPDQFVGNEIDVAAFAGSENIEVKSVGYVGRPESVRGIFESSIRLILSYAQAVIAGHFDAAFEHLASGLRERVTKASLAKTHAKISKSFGGDPISIVLEGFGWILADDEARTNQALAQIWPKETAPDDRRCTVRVFWIRDSVKRTGNPETWWIVEENRTYKIAKIEERCD